MIENAVEKKQLAKAGFTAEAFQFTASEEKLLEQEPGTGAAIGEASVETAGDAVGDGSTASAAIVVEKEENFDAI